MGGLLAGIAALAVPMTARILIALGFSIVTIGGVTVAWGTVRDAIISNLGAQAGAYVQIAGLGGVWTALGAVLGGMSFAVSMWALTKSVQVLGGGTN